MLTDMTLGQYYPGESVLHHMDPRAKIFCMMIAVITIFSSNSIYSYLFSTLFVILTVAISRVPPVMIWRAVKPLWFILIFTMIIHFFTTPGTDLISYGWFHITKEGFTNGIFMTLRLLLLIIFASLLTFTTSPIILTDGIESILTPLQRFGVPAHELAMMMTIALRFIPTLLEETDRIMKAQASRGADFINGNFLQRAKSMIPIMVPLFISSFRRADDLATAMEARCYRGGEGRTKMTQLSYGTRDYSAMTITIVALVIVFLMRYFSI